MRVEKPNYHCPVCGRPTYYKGCEEWKPFCSEVCAIKAATSGKAHDIALIPEADGAEFIKPTDGAREAFKGWATSRGKAQDGILSSPFMALAALLAILSYFNKETVGPQDYDLTTYKPKRKIF